MSPKRIAALVLGLSLTGFYGYRAVVGVQVGRAWDDGIHQMLSRDYIEAVPAFEKASVGFLRYDMERRTGDARIDIWEAEARRGGPYGADPVLLQETAQDYLNALCTAPAARFSWLGLALVYHKLEWMGRERRSEQPPFVAGVEPWSRVGRSGRVAIGMGRRAIESSPNWYMNYDWIAEAYWVNGLDAEAREAVRQAARALPMYYRHEFSDGSLADWAPDLFFETSREMVGKTRLLPRASHLVDLGKQARGRGAPEDAVEVLTEALDVTLDSLIRAEAHFHLGLSYVALGRDVEGREQLALAAENPVFHGAALRNLARAAEQVGDYAGALDYLRELRREDPRDLDYCLRSARLARLIQDWPVALEALQWGMIIESSDPRPYLALIETYLAMGDLTSARTAFRDLEKLDAEALPAELRRRLAED